MINHTFPVVLEKKKKTTYFQRTNAGGERQKTYFHKPGLFLLLLGIKFFHKLDTRPSDVLARPEAGSWARPGQK